ncbi:ubiquitin-like protein 7 [Ostrea edulis]|uniref:ubiquitin-like protein 7 n=1 Tax=Ostrea edulis TaxID=37623 RepID=UPI00209522F2|nr:ubiquitin-like protein 7 [Ostrea edulis]
MTSLTVCNSIDPGKPERLKINAVNLKGSVQNLKDGISKTINKSVSEFEVIYCGQCLDEQKPLETYGLKNGVILYLVKKHHKEPRKSPEKMSDMAMSQLAVTLQSALLSPSCKHTIEKMLNSPEALERLISATPGLEGDPVAISMLQDQELLTILAHPENIKQVVDKHPAFGYAAMTVCQMVNEEGSGRDSDRITTGSFYLDQMSDDEDDSIASRPGPSSGGITASQLAAALASATGSTQGGATSQPLQNILPGAITADFFQQAIRQAQVSTDQGQLLQTQLQQLRDMGITDEALARRALQATGGDLQAALDMLFGDGQF